jgi:hypothetical protein
VFFQIILLNMTLKPRKSREPTAVQIVDCRQLVSGGKQFVAGGATAAADETPKLREGVEARRSD